MKFELFSEEREAFLKAVVATGWARLDAMTDEEIEAAAAADPDNPPMSAAELRELARLAVSSPIRDAAEWATGDAAE
jgi:hypothetical protein